MIEHQPVLTPTDAESSYRPVSGLAIAGLVLACLYAVLVLVSTSVALFKGTPLFLPDWVILFPLAGAVLSYLAQRQIRNSEGTRAGIGLARWGLGLSAFIGLGYFAYTYFTGLALASQAQAFLMERDVDAGFFPCLVAAHDDPDQVDEAFRLALPATERPKNLVQLRMLFGTRSAPGKANPMEMFRNDDLVQAIVNGGKNVRFESQGVRQWTFEKGGYRVDCLYRVDTPEVIFHVVAKVHSTEGEAGSRRKWSVTVPIGFTKEPEFTSLGYLLKKHADLARVMVMEEMEKSRTAKKKLPIRWGNNSTNDPVLRKTIETALHENPDKDFQITMAADPKKASSWKVVNGKLRFTIASQIRYFPKMQEAKVLLIAEEKEGVRVNDQGLPATDSFSVEPHFVLKEVVIEDQGPIQMPGAPQMPAP